MMRRRTRLMIAYEFTNQFDQKYMTFLASIKRADANTVLKMWIASNYIQDRFHGIPIELYKKDGSLAKTIAPMTSHIDEFKLAVTAGIDWLVDDAWRLNTKLRSWFYGSLVDDVPVVISDQELTLFFQEMTLSGHRDICLNILDNSPRFREIQMKEFIQKDRARREQALNEKEALESMRARFFQSSIKETILDLKTNEIKPEKKEPAQKKYKLRNTY